MRRSGSLPFVDYEVFPVQARWNYALKLNRQRRPKISFKTLIKKYSASAFSMGASASAVKTEAAVTSQG